MYKFGAGPRLYGTDASEQVRVWYLWYQVPTPPSVFREDLCSTEEEEGGSDNICIYPS